MISDVIQRHQRPIGIIRQRDNEAFEYDDEGDAVRTETAEEEALAHIQSPTTSDLQSLPEGERNDKAKVFYSLEKMEQKDILIADGQEYTAESVREFRDNETAGYRAVALWKSERKVENNEPS
jgi:hypothetical protein